MPNAATSSATPRMQRAKSPPASKPMRQAEAACQRGLALRQSGQLQAARESFAQAARLAPRDPLYWLQLARTEMQLGVLDDAERHTEKAFEIDRSNLGTCCSLARMKWRAHRARETRQVLDALAAGVKRDALWHLLRGQALLAENEPKPAAMDLLQVLALEGSDPKMRSPALTLLGNAFSQLKLHDNAGQCYRIGVDADPLDMMLACHAAHYSAWACNWKTLEEDLSRLESAIAVAYQGGGRDSEVTQSNSPFILMALRDDPALLLWAARKNWSTARCPPRDSRPVPRPNGRVRIGWISSDFHNHATTELAVEVLEAMDRDRFELYFYSNSPDDGSAERRRVLATASRTHEVASWSDAEIAHQVRRDEIGVLVDLKGFTLASRIQAMMSRPAPLQISWLGYPGTSGAEFIDYIVGDPVVTPLAAQAHFSECIAQMPHCYQPNDSTRPQPARLTRAECGLPEDAIVLGSFNQSYKILPPVFDAWCRILAHHPQAVLWLLVVGADTQNRLRLVASAHGIDPQRLVFAPYAPLHVHRARLPNADLVLDTYPCGGHTTTSDALWAGVPVLTVMGQSFPSRVAASLIHALGVPELVCEDLDRYVAQARHFIADADALADLRRRVERGRSQSPLFQGRQFAADFEALLMRMVERQDAGLPPAPLAAGG